MVRIHLHSPSLFCLVAFIGVVAAMVLFPSFRRVFLPNDALFAFYPQQPRTLVFELTRNGVLLNGMALNSVPYINLNDGVEIIYNGNELVSYS